MKKTLLTILCVFAGLCGIAQNSKTYSEPLVVTVNGESSEPVMIDVNVVDNGNGTINFELKNFFLEMEGEKMGIGNIVLENLSAVEGEDGLKHFSYEGPLTITAGDAEGVEFWMGPMLGEIPLNLQGKLNDEKLFVTIGIDMQSVMGQTVFVQLGTDDFLASKSMVYNEPLVITVNGESSEPVMIDVNVVDNGNGTINFELKNFFLEMEGQKMGIGNIVLENLSVVEGEDGLKHFSYEGPLTITAGDAEGVEFWMGPMLGEIPLNLQGKLNDEKLFVTIGIDMQSVMGQTVFVQLGTDDFQTPGILGDLNGDGSVDIADAVSILDLMANASYSKDADLNHDNSVDVADFVSVLDIMAAQ